MGNTAKKEELGNQKTGMGADQGNKGASFGADREEKSGNLATPKSEKWSEEEEEEDTEADLGTPPKEHSVQTGKGNQNI